MAVAHTQSQIQSLFSKVSFLIPSVLLNNQIVPFLNLFIICGVPFSVFSSLTLGSNLSISSLAFLSFEFKSNSFL